MMGPDTNEMAALYALGVLDADETRRIEQRRRSGDSELETEIESFQHVVGAIGASIPSVRPDERLRGRMFDRIRRPDSPGSAGLPAGLAALARANEMPWKRTPFAGIRQKRLYTNTSDGTTVWLVQMEAGSFYPPHHHTSIEHTYVISGDIVFDGYVLVAGEYQAALPDTNHDKPITTNNGCTVLIINNAKDEIFAMPGTTGD